MLENHKMKKLFLYIFLGLLWCNVSFAYDSKMCITLKLSLTECIKKKAECKKMLLSEKQCSEKIRKDRRLENTNKLLENIKNQNEKNEEISEQTDKFKGKYYCEQKDDSGEITAWSEILLRNFNVVNKTLSLTKDAKKYFFVEQGSQDKKFAMYDEGKLKWFDIDLEMERLFYDYIEIVNGSTKNKALVTTLFDDYKKFDKLYQELENSKKNHSGPIHKNDKYFRDLENYFYASNALFKERIKNNNFL